MMDLISWIPGFLYWLLAWGCVLGFSLGAITSVCHAGDACARQVNKGSAGATPCYVFLGLWLAIFVGKVTYHWFY